MQGGHSREERKGFSILEVFLYQKPHKVLNPLSFAPFYLIDVFYCLLSLNQSLLLKRWVLFSLCSLMTVAVSVVLTLTSACFFCSPSGCTFWGKKPWSRKKKILWQLGTLIGAPVGISLIAGIAIPAMVIGIPVYVGRKVRHAFLGLLQL